MDSVTHNVTIGYTMYLKYWLIAFNLLSIKNIMNELANTNLFPENAIIF